MSRLSDLLEKRPVICDGAVGTELYSRSGTFDQCLDYLNLTHPDLVRSVHRDYAKAGAQIIETNTFGSNRIKLMMHGLSDEAREITLAGAALAKEEAGAEVLVAGSVGPTGKLLEPYGTVPIEEAEQAFIEQTQALADGGVDIIFVETMVDLQEACAAVRAAKATGLPVVAQMSFAQEGHTMMGVEPVQAVHAFEELDVDAVGANCGTGFHDMLSVVKEMIPVAAKPVIAQPNAGFPRLVEGRTVYVSTPEYMADYARKFAELGVAIIGGCCGTTPDHIRATVQALRR